MKFIFNGKSIDHLTDMEIDLNDDRVEITLSLKNQIPVETKIIAFPCHGDKKLYFTQEINNIR